ncbi:MAG TPA: sialidase family protein [Myxococcota bacterium]|jgi:hypothetical protein|nr:sialidase family protein [Myxococcota bacterium]
MGNVDPFLVTGLFPGSNVQVTHATAKQPRSESAIVVDPHNANRLLGISKRFTDPQKYRFTLGPVVSTNGGSTWTDLPKLPLVTEQDVYTDPSAAFHTSGEAMVMGDPGFYQADHPSLYSSLQCASHGQNYDLLSTQMLVFKSADDGAHWGNGIPVVDVRCTGDDKGWLACDNAVPTSKKVKKSPYDGRLYAIWGAVTPLRFARSTDGGDHWTGAGNAAAGADLTLETVYAPDISIARDGTIHVFWHNLGTDTVLYLRSKDGGETFEGNGTSGGLPVPRIVVQGLKDLDSGVGTGGISSPHGWANFEGSNFRVFTLVSACCFGDHGVAVAWADTTSGHSRIHYRVSYDGGDNWEGPDAGTPMLPYLSGDSHQFHPQLAATATGVLGCAIYSYSKTARPGNKPGIDVLVAGSFDDGVAWDFQPITDQPWDPAVNAPWAHSDPNVTFIGDYFGFDAGETEFHVLWTDTRTGNQDLFYCRVGTQTHRRPDLGEIVATYLSPGVSRDGGGFIIVGGHVIRIPPWDPLRELLTVAAAISDVSRLTLADSARARGALYDLLISVAQKAKSGLTSGTGGG